MTNPYQLTVTLKQHTPIIHFQHEQNGATLRATELKPKLDEYLWIVFNQIGLPETKTGKWIIPGTQKALNYKLKVTNVKGLNKLPTTNLIPLYFGDIGSEKETTNDTDQKRLIMADHLDLNVHSFFPELIELINEHLDQFLWQTNFGCRQSKGFGSFTRVDSERSNGFFDLTFELNVGRRNQALDRLAKIQDDLKDEIKFMIRMFAMLEVFYKSLRSGINRKKNKTVTLFYIKPAIFYYAKDILNEQWDKKSIKEAYLTNHEYNLEKQKEKHRHADILTYSSEADPNNKLLKDLFGLSTDEEWGSYRIGRVSKNNGDIDRYKSPLLFKPIKVDESTFFIGCKAFNVDPGFLNQTFKIKMGNQSGLELDTPASFSWNDFFDYVCNRKTAKPFPALENRCSSTNGGHENEPEFQILRQIYNQIQ